MDQVRKLLCKLYAGVGTSRARRLTRLVQAGQWAQLQAESLAPIGSYHSANAYMRDALVVEMTRKLLLPGDATARSKATLERWRAGEHACFRTNGRLARYLNHGPYDPEDVPVIDFINRWRKEAWRLFGQAPGWLDIHFSGGSTLSNAGKLTTIPDKMSSAQTVYRRSIQLFNDSRRFTVMEDLPTQVVRSNQYFEVPKDSAVNRACCMEASGSLSLQLAVGRHLKKMYQKRYGVDLKTAPRLHQELAKAGSLTGEWATVDLSNASDTIARKLIELILPRSWVELLNSLRAVTTVVDGRSVFLEKFSSMGNGFTFELETALFRSLIAACGAGRDEAFVFGDDIVVPSHMASIVIDRLRFFGFTPNERKTFCEGPFRESCGGDFFEGTPVRAHYLKGVPDEPQHWVALANGLRRADPTFEYVKHAWRYCIDQLPSAWRVFGPSWLGDLVINDDETTPVLRMFKHRNHDGSVEEQMLPSFAVMRPVAKTFDLWSHFPPHVALAATLKGCDARVAVRKAVTGYRRDHVIAWGLANPEQMWPLLARERAIAD